MRLFIVRHADPDYPNDHITDHGHKEAAACAERFKKLGLDRLYTSPLGRARATCGYTAEALGMEPVVLDWTAELAGTEQEFEGHGRLCVWDTPGELIRAHDPLPGHTNYLELAPFNNRSVREHIARIDRESDKFLAGLGYVREGYRYRIERTSTERVAVFCHGGFGLTWLAHLLAIPTPLVWSGFWLSPTSVTTVLFDERSTSWAVPRCIGVADTCHLYEAGLPVLPRGIKANFE